MKTVLVTTRHACTHDQITGEPIMRMQSKRYVEELYSLPGEAQLLKNIRIHATGLEALRELFAC